MQERYFRIRNCRRFVNQ